MEEIRYVLEPFLVTALCTVEFKLIIMVSEFFPKNATFSKLYYGFFQGAEKVRDAVSRTP